MSAIKSLVNRNIKLYFRNKSTVFFSLLSMIIIVVLYALFMADVQIDSLAAQFGNRQAAKWLINAWIMGGIIAVNAVNITLVILVNMVEDSDKGIIKDFLVAPLKKYQIIGGYLLSSIILGILMSIFSFVIAQIYIVINGGEILGILEILKVLFGIVCTIISIATFFLFFLLFIKSEKTASVITTITGTLVGFIAGAYVPIGLMPEFIQKLMKLMPINYSATVFKQIFVERPGALLIKDSNKLLEFNKTLGNVIYFNNKEVTYINYIEILLLSAILFFILSLIKIKHDNKSNV